MPVSKLLRHFFSLLYLGLNWAVAQTPGQYAYAKPDSAKAYWTLTAAPADQTPTVQFYDDRHQLLYQETLPASAQRVDRPTRRALDKMLVNLVSNRLLSATYLHQQPEESIVYQLVQRPAVGQSLRHVVFQKGTAIVSVDPSLNSSGRLLVKCAQSANQLLSILLENLDHDVFFEKRFTTNAYQCTLNLEQLPSGEYRLKVGRQRAPSMYRLLIDQAIQHYELFDEDEWMAMH